jgi:hypothetical protein
MNPSQLTKKDVAIVKKDSYIQVTIKGEPFSIDGSHPTFNRMQRAIENKDWTKVGKLVNLAQTLYDDSHGKVSIKNGKVYYGDSVAHNAVADRMLKTLGQGKPIKHLMKFMDNLYKNPSEEAISELFGWLEANELPITDNGGFFAYKSVDNNNKDQHTHKIDNSPGQIIMTTRDSVDTNWRRQCSSGFHICSKQYGLYGTKVMAVLTYPQYVLSAEGGKLRVTWYEVLKELGIKDGDDFIQHGFSELENKLVIHVHREKIELLAMLRKLPEIKRSIRKKKLKLSTLKKYSTARLAAMCQKRGLIAPEVGPQSTQLLQSARKAAGLSIGQVAKQLKVGYKTVVLLEKKADPPQDKVDSYTTAIAKLVGVNLTRGAITFPKAMQVAN